MLGWKPKFDLPQGLASPGAGSVTMAQVSSPPPSPPSSLSLSLSLPLPPPLPLSLSLSLSLRDCVRPPLLGLPLTPPFHSARDFTEAKPSQAENSRGGLRRV